MTLSCDPWQNRLTSLMPGCCLQIRGCCAILEDEVYLEGVMTVRFVHWQDGADYLGYLMDYPDYMTQGSSMEDLQEHLVSLYKDLTFGELHYVKKVDELVVTV
jgi:hypothetical protein